MSVELLLVGAAGELQVAALEVLLEVFVDGEGDSLAGGDSHDAGGDALVESVETFLPVKIVSQSFNWGILRQVLATCCVTYLNMSLAMRAILFQALSPG